MSLFKQFAGIISPFFQIGGPSGSGINLNGTALEAKDSANSVYVNMRGADPVANNDLVTLEYGNTNYAPNTPAALPWYMS